MRARNWSGQHVDIVNLVIHYRDVNDVHIEEAITMIDTHLITVALTTTGICVAVAVALAAAIIAISAATRQRRTSRRGPAAPAGRASTTLAHETLTDSALSEPRVPALR
jgi:hypothetical protein